MRRVGADELQRQLEIQELQHRLEVAELDQEEKRRRARMRAANQWLGFVVAKAIGACLCFFGLFEIMAPDLLSVETPSPAAYYYLGVGSALLIGKPLIRWLRIVTSSAEGDSP